MYGEQSMDGEFKIKQERMDGSDAFMMEPLVEVKFPEKKKIVRSQNFSETEALLLAGLVARNGHEIKIRPSNGAEWRARQELWEKIASDYNTVNEIPRTAKCLKVKYIQLKKLARAKINGTNPGKKQLLTPAEEVISAVVAEDDDDSSQWDCEGEQMLVEPSWLDTSMGSPPGTSVEATEKNTSEVSAIDFWRENPYDSTNEKNSKGKKQRSTNFSEAESVLLAKLVFKYQDKLGKKNGKATEWKEKRENWVKITEEFNSRSKTFRSAQCLINRFRWLKKRSRSKSAQSENGGTDAFTQSELIIGAVIGVNRQADDDAGEFKRKKNGPLPKSSFHQDGMENQGPNVPVEPSPTPPPWIESSLGSPPGTSVDILQKTMSEDSFTPNLDFDEMSEGDFKPQGGDETQRNELQDDSQIRTDLLKADIESKIRYRELKSRLRQEKQELECRLLRLQCEQLERLKNEQIEQQKSMEDS